MNYVFKLYTGFLKWIYIENLLFDSKSRSYS